MPRRNPAPLLAILPCLMLPACSGDGNVARDIAFASGITGGEPKPAPDFVTRTREPAADYMPIGVQPPARRYRAKKADAVAGAEGDLAKTRSFNEARGAQARRAGASPAPAVPKRPADPPLRP